MTEAGDFLKSLREEKKLSLREAAKKSGLSHSYINSLELGRHPKTKVPINPSPESLKRLSDAYNYPYPILMKVAGYIRDTEPLIEEEMEKHELLELIKKYKIIDLSDNKLLDISMFYGDMELTMEEKKEFMAIYRGIFSARRAMR